MTGPSTLISALVATLLATSLTGCSRSPAEAADVTTDIRERIDALDGPVDPNTLAGNERERLTQVEELVARCMKANGFDYRVVTPERLLIYVDDAVDHGTRAWAERFGFGVSTTAFSQEQVGPGLVGYLQKRAPTNPNEEYVETLAPEERSAYFATLLGPLPTPTVDEDGTVEPIAVGGCVGEATATSMSGAAAEQQRFLDAFGDALDDLEARFDSHPDTVAHRTAALACMAAHGYEYQSMEEVRTAFGSQSEKLELDVIIASTTGQSLSGAQFFAPHEDPELTPETLGRLAELQHDEIETALVAEDCGFSEAAEDRALGDLRARLELGWIEERRDALSTFLAAGTR